MANSLAPTPINALASLSQDENPYITSLMSRARQQYPFINKHNPQVIIGTDGQGYAETYPIGETGRPLENGGFSRPTSLPIDKIGVEIYRPGDFTHHDLAAEMLHIDPMANSVREKLMQSWTPKQLKALRKHALDYQATLDEGRSETDAIQNATDSALRGYTVGQWPEEINKAIGYDAKQKAMLDALKSYMTTPSK